MKLYILLYGICMAGMAWANDVAPTNDTASTTNHIVITSDRLDYDYPRAVAVFTGNVLVRDGDMRMWSDKMTVILTAQDEIESVTAIGHVVIVQPGRKARCRKAIFLVDKNEVILTGNAVVDQGKDRVEGRIIHIWTDSERMVSEPGHLVVFSKGHKAEAEGQGEGE